MSIKECIHCNLKFISEEKLNAHKCKLRDKFDISKTNTGITAFNAYKNWRKLKGYSEPELTTFVESKYFNSFIKFVEFCKRANIPNKMEYIKVMVKMNALPNIWLNTEMFMCYNTYMNDKPSVEKVKDSVNTILKLSSMFECGTSDIFSKLQTNELITLLKSKKLSPWLLLFSKKFFNYLQFNASEEQRIIIRTFISPEIWKAKIEKEPELVKKIKLYVSELGI